MNTLTTTQILTLHEILHRYMHHNCPANSSTFRDLEKILHSLEDLLNVK